MDVIKTNSILGLNSIRQLFELFLSSLKAFIKHDHESHSFGMAVTKVLREITQPNSSHRLSQIGSD